MHADRVWGVCSGFSRLCEKYRCNCECLQRALERVAASGCRLQTLTPEQILWSAHTT